MITGATRRMTSIAIGAALACLPCMDMQAAGFSGSGKGTTAVQFLKLGAGARAAGMGDAYSAATDEASALYWNPAALTRVEHQSLTFMHAPYIDSSFFDYGAYAWNMGNRGALGASLQYMSAGKITQTDTSGSDTGSFTPNDMALSLGYAYRFREAPFIQSLEEFSFGLSGKIIRSNIINSAQTWTADFGVLSPALLADRLRLAWTVANLGGTIKYEQETESLPLLMRLGAACNLTSRWLATLDTTLPKDDEAYVSLGTEYVLPVSEGIGLAGRLGFNTSTMGDVDGLTGISLGLGFNFNRFDIDYAFIPVGSIGLTHRVSLSWAFGGRRDADSFQRQAAPARASRQSPRPGKNAGSEPTGDAEPLLYPGSRLR